jgi:hypothetical protein
LLALRADASPATVEDDDVVMLQLTSAASVDLAVDRDEAVDDGFLHVTARVEQASELHELAEADAVAPDRDVDDPESFSRAEMLTGGGMRRRALRSGPSCRRHG